MATLPAPSITFSREDWSDVDFDLPQPGMDKDWDLEIHTGRLKESDVVTQMSSISESSAVSRFSDINIRPPLLSTDSQEDDEEGVSTIKATTLRGSSLSKPLAQPLTESVCEDLEEAFALPLDLKQLSLAPLTLNHRASKISLEWGDKDNSSSSQSSDAYSTLGFADASPSSNSTSSPSLPDTETEEDEDDLEGLVLPSAFFESPHSAQQLKGVLESKKKILVINSVNHHSPDREENFESGLVINDDVDLSPSRLILNTRCQSQRDFLRTSPRLATLKPTSRPKVERSNSLANPPSSSKQLQKLRLSPPPSLQHSSRSQSLHTLASGSPAPFLLPPDNVLPAKQGNLRAQKSHSGLKPPTPSSGRKFTRKASLSSLVESSHAQPIVPSEQIKVSRYDEPTAASRAKSHKSATSRIHDFKVPPIRPHTPSANPAALRLTMPTQSRLRSRPALSQVFGGPVNGEVPRTRPTSPLHPRPPSSSSLHSNVLLTAASHRTPVITKVLRKPKRQKAYGDGTELEGFEDLPIDREKEVRYRVQLKGYGNRIPGGTFSPKIGEKEKVTDESQVNSLRRDLSRNELASLSRKKKNISASALATKRKPTLIRNLGGSSVHKVIGDMRWNPQSLRWEGNDQVLRDFDVAVGTSMRPALITHITGSNFGALGSFGSGTRVVGTMAFDPLRMCWISTLPPDEVEPDVFANLADDEDEDDARVDKGGTIRATLSNESASPDYNHSRSVSDSGSDRGSRAAINVRDIDDAFIRNCRDAEDRHHAEMKGWKASGIGNRSQLYEIRALATRQY